MTEFNPLIFVMRARDIPSCLSSLRLLPYSKVWVEYHWEEEIAGVFPDVLEKAIEKGYTHLSMFSDDAVISPRAAEMVFEAMNQYSVVAGWCNIDQGPLSNISKSKLTSKVPYKEIIKILYTIKEIENHPKPIFQTWFTGNSFHTMSVDLWKKFPFNAYPPQNKHPHSICSDLHLCSRLQDAGIPMMVVRDSRIVHFKGPKYKGIRSVLCGVRPKNIRWDEI